MRRLLPTLGSLLLLATLPGASAAAAVADPGATQRVIVVLADGAGDPGAVAVRLGRERGFTPGLIYRHALRGFAASMPSRAVDALARDPRVRSIEPDHVATIQGQTTPTGISRINATTNTGLGVDGIDKRVDVDVAVIDTGIDLKNGDLNIAGGVDCRSSSGCIAGGQDDNGHGTHVSGTIGALDNGNAVVGVAPGARMWAVKVLDRKGSGTMSAIIAGVDWVTANAATIEVANMSLGCSCSQPALDTAISNSVKAGVVYVVAAGNSGMDAKGFSPANNPDVITVSALADYDGRSGGLAKSTCYADVDDTLAAFSNYGNTIELTAPGVCILSLAPGGKLATMSGTSMASPHVAGAAAILASISNPSTAADVAAIRSTLIAAGSSAWTDDSRDKQKEPLLDVGDATKFTPVYVP